MQVGVSRLVIGYRTANGPPLDPEGAGLLTHVNHSFATVDPDGTLRLPEAGARALRALRSVAGVRLMLSIGGWGRGSAGFPIAAATAAGRRRFAEQCLEEFVLPYRLDGIDLDWEFPVRGGIPEIPARPDDRTNLTELVREVRRVLDRGAGRDRLLLTAAIPAGRLQEGGFYDPGDSFELSALAPVLDWFNLMTYDLTNGYAPRTGFNAGLRSLAADPAPESVRVWNSQAGALDYLASQGIPMDRVVVGVPFYGRRFDGLAGGQDGLFANYGRVHSTPSYRELTREYLPDRRWRRHWSEEAASPWLHDPERRSFVSYDDPRSIAAKCRYAVRRGVRGVMCWELAHDAPDLPLLRAMSGAAAD